MPWLPEKGRKMEGWMERKEGKKSGRKKDTHSAFLLPTYFPIKYLPFA